MSNKTRKLKRAIEAADVALRANPDDLEAKKARVAAVVALNSGLASPVGRRRKAFLDELGRRADASSERILCLCGAPWGEPLDAHRPGVGVTHAIEGGDLRDAWQPLTFGERLRLMPVLMDAWFLIAFATGFRDRMRCPRCTAVGAWKMHGTWFERWRYGDIALRRWGCKYCGHWIARGSPNGDLKNGRIVAFPISQEGLKVWGFPDPSIKREPTPAETMYATMGRTWPWFG